MSILHSIASITLACGLAAPHASGGTSPAHTALPAAATPVIARNNTFDLFARMVGGEWIHEATDAAGNVFRVRNVARFGPGAQSIVIDGWLGTGAGMFYHANTQVRIAPSILTTLTRMPEAATGQSYRLSLERLGVRTPFTVLEEDASAQFYL